MCEAGWELLSYHKGSRSWKKNQIHNPTGVINSPQQHTIYGKESKTAEMEQKVWTLEDEEGIPDRVLLPNLTRRLKGGTWEGNVCQGCGWWNERGVVDSVLGLMGMAVIQRPANLPDRNSAQARALYKQWSHSCSTSLSKMSWQPWSATEGYTLGFRWSTLHHRRASLHGSWK